MPTPGLANQTNTKLHRIAWLSGQDPNKVYQNLMHLFNRDSLTQCYHELDGHKAVGTDGMNKASYGQQLEANLKGLVTRLKGMSYRPGVRREVLIPKGDKAGAMRKLAISNFEDKLVQRMMHKVLESIYEPLFLPCSFGFRPGRGCHDAIRALRNHLETTPVTEVMDIDLANFFDSIDHQLLQELVSKKIADKRLRRYLARMLKSGVLKHGELTLSEEGVVQGAICSPILANIYAHEVLDRWFEETVKAHCAGQVAMFRYADDAVICCERQQDAQRIRKALVERLAKYKLRLNEEKTRIVSLSKAQARRGVRQQTFDFLGFTFYLGRSRRGNITTKLKSSGRRMATKLKRIKQWVKMVKDKQRLRELWPIFCQKLSGHIRYYGVSFNIRSVATFLNRAENILFKWLNQRSQKRSFTWEKFKRFLERNPLPRAKVHHKLW